MSNREQKHRTTWSHRPWTVSGLGRMARARGVLWDEGRQALLLFALLCGGASVVERGDPRA